MNRIYSLIIIIILLSSCKHSIDGTYLVYRSTLGSFDSPLRERIRNKYVDSQYGLTFTEKYVKIVKDDTSNFYILEHKPSQDPGTEMWQTTKVQGADSVTVFYELKINTRDTILTISVNTKGFTGGPMRGPEASVDFYLSHAVK